jgi:Zn-dependent metalloprotease
MKNILLVFVVFGSLTSCESRTGFQEIDWSNKSGKPLPAELKKIDLKTDIQKQTRFEKVEFLSQQLHGIPLENTFVKKIYSNKGELLFISGIVDDRAAGSKDEVENLKEQQSLVISRLRSRYPEMAKLNTFEKPELIFEKKGKVFELKWRCVYFDLKGLPWQLLLNKEGAIEKQERVGSQFEESVATVFPLGPLRSSLTDVTFKNLMSTSSLKNSRLVVTSLSDAKLPNTNNLKFSPPDERFDEVQVFYFVNKALDWFETRLGVTLTRVLDVQVHLGAPEKTNGAFYYQGRIRIGSGDGVVYAKMPQDPTVVMHETAHALIDEVARLPFQEEGGSLNEGFADFLTAVQLNQPNMGEVSFVAGPYRRTIDNELKLSDKNGGLYHDSGIVSGTLWELKSKIGAEKSVDIALKLLISLNPQSDFADFKKKILETLPVLLQDKDLATAQEIMKSRGFL